MNIQMLTSFFMWCTVINVGILGLWAVIFMFSPGFVYRIHNKLFPMPRETWNAMIYGFLGFYKILFIIFCLVPWLALLLMGK